MDNEGFLEKDYTEPEVNEEVSEEVVENTEDNVEEEVEEVEEYNVEDHLKSLSGDDDDMYELLKEKQEKYSLDKDAIEKYNNMVQDEASEVQERADAEYESLSESDKKSIKPTFDFLSSKVGEGDINMLKTLFNSKEGLKFAQKLAENMSQSLPSDSVETSSKENEFTMDEYSDFSERISALKRDHKHSEARELGEEMKTEIRRRGSNQMKKDFSL